MFKSYEFTHKDIPFLKKDFIMRVFFAFLFLFVFIWQFVLLVIRYTAKDITGIMMGVAIFTMILSLFMGVVAVLYAYKSFITIKMINKNGNMIRRMPLLGTNTKKTSFIRLYSILSKILAVVMLMLFASGITYAILDLIFKSAHSFYLPILLLITISGFNSVYHLQMEIQTINNVQEYNSIY